MVVLEIIEVEMVVFEIVKIEKVVTKGPLT